MPKVTPPITITKVYYQGYFGILERRRAEKKLHADGYKAVNVEDFKEWEAGNACCLGLIFFPLLFMKTKKIKVTYEKTNQ